jgi:hypothetical protein
MTIDMNDAERTECGTYPCDDHATTDEPTPPRRVPRSISSLIADPPPTGEIVVLAGLISALERRVNANGEPWAIVTLQDLGAAIRVLFAPADYTSWAVDLVEGAPVVITGRASQREDTVVVSGPTVGVAAPPDVEDAPRLVIRAPERTARFWTREASRLAERAGWSAYGTHADQFVTAGALEFDGSDECGMPLWERPAGPSRTDAVDDAALVDDTAFYHAILDRVGFRDGAEVTAGGSADNDLAHERAQAVLAFLDHVARHFHPEALLPKPTGSGS